MWSVLLGQGDISTNTSSIFQTSRKLAGGGTVDSSLETSCYGPAGTSYNILPSESAGIFSYPEYLNTHPPSPNINDFTASDQQELNHFKQQVKNHWANFSPEPSGSCETSCSTDVKTAFQAGRIVM
jgi:hypothetical protein